MTRYRVCPRCGAGLNYHTHTGWVCEGCRAHYSSVEVKALEARQASGAVHRAEVTT